jgi:hypothetical protein
LGKSKEIEEEEDPPMPIEPLPLSFREKARIMVVELREIYG